MCGISGYIGKKEGLQIVLGNLRKLEYRGYDSAGIAVLNDHSIEVIKKPGKLTVLKKELAANPLTGHVSLGHSRWATHGIPNEANAHPHWDCRKEIALVHNGIIENYQDLKERLIKEGHEFR